MGRVRLLNKTLLPMSMFALLTLALSIPAYYFIVDFIWINELDKHHESVKLKVEKEMNALNLSDSALSQTLLVWNQVNPGSTFTEVDASQISKDSTYSITRFDDFQQDREKFRCLVTYIHINHKTYRLLVETNMEETDETIMVIGGVTAVFFIFLLIGFVVLSRILSKKIWKPFYSTLERLTAFNITSKENITFENSEIYEFEQLNVGLEKLIDKNIAAYKQQKEFTENASHELQTPLAIIKSQLDILLQHKELTNNQYEIVESIHRTLTRAHRINKNLLLLSKIENQQLYAESESVNISGLVNDMLETLQEHISNKTIWIDIQIANNIYINGNKALLEVLVNNLLLNAIRHTKSNGKISVNLSEQEFIISNSGEESLDTNKLYKRFVSVSIDTSGSGLGLAIVKQITQRFAWEVDYRFENSMHVFSLLF